jgi:CPA1 family monovalent cation:H+ antiporter
MLSTPQIVALLIGAVLVTVVSRWVRLSYTIALLLLGLLLGAAPIAPVPTLNADVILFLFLPPLIFEAVFVMDLQHLWELRGAVLTLAVPGTVLAMVVGGAVVRLTMAVPWAVALLFGAMIAATDPVSVLATFRELGVDPRLTLIVEGESLLNDGVALVLFVALTTVVTASFTPGAAVTTLIMAVVAGIAIGTVVGALGHLMIASIDERFTEMTVSVATAYGAFLAADVLGASGVLATIAAGMTLGVLGRRSGWLATGGSARLLVDLWAFLAFIANAGLFLLVGLTDRTAGLREFPHAVAAGIVAALVGRAATAYGLGTLLDRLGLRISRVDRHVLFWGGLRGAVALAAALSLPVDFPYRLHLLAMTYGVVLFTLLAQGLTITPLVRVLRVPRGAPADHRV